MDFLRLTIKICYSYIFCHFGLVFLLILVFVYSEERIARSVFCYISWDESKKIKIMQYNDIYNQFDYCLERKLQNSLVCLKNINILLLSGKVIMLFSAHFLAV